MEPAELKGTEKQASWARAIRKDRLKAWQAADSDSFKTVESMLTQQDSAAWWITSRDKSLGQVCSQLQNGDGPKIPGKRAAFSPPQKVGIRKADEEVWDTVLTALGFTRSGPTRDVVTGEVVNDVTLPF